MRWIRQRQLAGGRRRAALGRALHTAGARSLRVESLEDRCLLAALAPLTYDMALHPAIDSVTVQRDGADIVVVESATGNVLASAPVASTDRVLIEGEDGGDDHVTVDFTGGSPVPTGGLQFSGGTQATTAGDSLAIVGTFDVQTLHHASAGADGNNGSVLLDDAPITYTGLEAIDAGNAVDTIVNLPDAPANHATVQNSSNAGQIEVIGHGDTFADTVIPNPTRSLTVNLGDAGDTLHVAALDSAFAATLDVNGGSGADVVNVLATKSGTVTTVNAGDGADTVNVGSTYEPSTSTLADTEGGSLHDIQGVVTVDGGLPAEGAGDVLRVLDFSNPVGTRYLIDAHGVMHGPAAIGYANIETLLVRTGTAGDTVVISDTGAQHTTVDAGAGSDAVIVLSTASDAEVQIDGGHGNDAITLISSGANSTVQLSGQTGADRIDVRATGAGSTTVADGGYDPDGVNVGSEFDPSASTLDGIQGVVHVEGGSVGLNSGDVLNVNDAANAVASTYVIDAAGVMRGNAVVGYSYIESLTLTAGTAGNTIVYNGTGADANTLNAGTGADTVVIEAIAAGGALVVNGQEGNDAITLISSGTNAAVQLNGQHGSDRLDVRGTGVGSTTAVDGGRDVDRFNVGSEFDPFASTLNGIQGTVIVDGGPPTNRPGDTLNVNDAANSAAGVYTIDAGGVLRSGLAIGYGNIETLTLNTSSVAADRIVIAAAAEMQTDVHAGGGGDVIVVDSTGANATVQVHGQAGNDYIVLVSSGANAQVELNGQAGSDHIGVRRTGAGSTTAVSGGSEADSVQVASEHDPAAGNLDGILGLVSVDGGANDLLNVSDRGGGGDPRGALGATQITGLGNAAAISYHRIAELNLNLSNLADTLNITGTHAGLTSINGTGGDDSVNVSATAVGSTTNINGGDGDDAVTIGRFGNVMHVRGTVAFDGGVSTSRGDALVVDGRESAAGTYSLLPTAVLKDDGAALLVGFSNVDALTLNTGWGDDEIDISAPAAAVTTVNAGRGNDAVNLNASAAESTIHVNGDAGNDGINVRGTAVGSATTVDGGDDIDFVNISSDAPANRGNLDGIGGIVTVDGDLAETLHVSDIGGMADAAGVLSATQITGLGNDGAIRYSVGTLKLGLSNGPDTLTVSGTHAGTTTIDGHEGGDTFNVRATGGTTAIHSGDHVDTFNVSSDAPANLGNMEAIAAPLLLNGDAGADVANISDRGSTRHSAGNLDATQISYFGGAAEITYASLSELKLDLSDYGDQLHVSGTHAGMTRINGHGGGDYILVLETAAGSMTQIRGDDGDDRLRIGGVGTSTTVTAVQGTVDYDGGSNGDRVGDSLAVIDTASAAASYRVLPDAVLKDGGTGLRLGYGGIESFTLETGSEADQVIADMPPGVGANLRSGSGADQIQLNSAGAGSRVILSGEGGDDTIAVAATHETSTTLLRGDAGNDDFHLGAASGVADQILGSLTVDGGPSNSEDASTAITRRATVTARRSPHGVPESVSVSQSIQVYDRLFLRDEANSFAGHYTIDEHYVSRYRNDVWYQYRYFGIDLVDIRTGSGGDSVDIAGTPDGLVLDVVMTGAADQSDSVRVRGTGADSITAVQTGAGGDDIEIRDYLGTRSTGVGSTVLIDSAAGDDRIVLETVGAGAGLDVNAGPGADRFWLHTGGADSPPLAPPAAVAMKGGDASDTFVIWAVLSNAAVDLRGEGGNDTFDLRPTASTPDGALKGLTDDASGTIRDLLIDGGSNDAATREIRQGAVVTTGTSTTPPYTHGSVLTVDTATSTGEIGDVVNLHGQFAAAALDLRFHIHGQGDSSLFTALPGDRSTAAALVEVSEQQDIETVNLLTGSGDDSLTVTSVIPLNASSGSDALLTFDGGAGGQDLLQIRGTAADDQITVGALSASPSGGSRYPFEIANTEFLRIDALTGDDQIVNHTSAIGVFNGAAGKDVIVGGSHDDLIAGGAGVDALFGRDGNDLVLSDQDSDETHPDPNDVADGDLLDGGPHVAGRAPEGDAFVQQGLDRVRNFEFGSWQGAQLDLHTWMQQRFLTPHQVINEARLSRFGRAPEEIPASPDVTPVSGSSAEGEGGDTLPRSANARVDAVDQALANWDADDLPGDLLRSQR